MGAKGRSPALTDEEKALGLKKDKGRAQVWQTIRSKDEDNRQIIRWQSGRCRSCRNKIDVDSAKFAKNFSRKEGVRNDARNERAFCKECNVKLKTVTMSIPVWQNELLNEIVESFPSFFKSKSHFLRYHIEKWNYRKLIDDDEREEFLSDWPEESRRGWIRQGYEDEEKREELRSWDVLFGSIDRVDEIGNLLAGVTEKLECIDDKLRETLENPFMGRQRVTNLDSNRLLEEFLNKTTDKSLNPKKRSRVSDLSRSDVVEDF